MTGSARAGIHTPCPIILDAEAEAFCPNKRRWLWVPAFAGTTQEDSNVRQQTQHCDPAARCVRAVHELFRPEERAQGNAGCPLHPQSVCKGRKHTGVTTGTPEHPAFPAQGRVWAQKPSINRRGVADVSSFVSRSAADPVTG